MTARSHSRRRRTVKARYAKHLAQRGISLGRPQERRRPTNPQQEDDDHDAP